MTDVPTPEERQAKIDQMIASTMFMLTDMIKREQDIRFAPWALLATGAGATAAVFAAAIALLKWLH